MPAYFQVVWTETQHRLKQMLLSSVYSELGSISHVLVVLF